MNLVDSWGWLEYFADGPNATFFAPAIQGCEHLLVPTIVMYEVMKRTLQQRGEEFAIRALGFIQQGLVVHLDTATAVLAARFSLRFQLPMADSFILATAELNDAVV